MSVIDSRMHREGLSDSCMCHGNCTSFFNMERVWDNINNEAYTCDKQFGLCIDTSIDKCDHRMLILDRYEKKHYSKFVHCTLYS